MFYSHQILARKGPLAIVWIAAHLQHRLRKTQYIDADILPIIDRILVPEAPIALRMSGHLLLGVVRIYSKKAEYLFIDCNEAVAKVAKIFTTTAKVVSTAEGAPTAAFEDITLPERYELDAMDLDLHNDGDADGFRKDPEEITLPDQTPISRDPYIGRTFDEDILMIFTNNDVPDSLGSRPKESGQLPDQIVIDGNEGVSIMEADTLAPSSAISGLPSRDLGPRDRTEISKDILQCQGSDPSNQMDDSVRFEDHCQNNQTETMNDSLQFLDPDQSNKTNSNVRFEDHGQNNQSVVNDNVLFLNPDQSNQTSRVDERTYQDTSPENIPEIEVMRNAAHDSSLFERPMQHNLPADVTIPHSSVGHVTNEKISLSPAMEDMIHSAGISTPFQQHKEQRSFAASDRDPVVFATHFSLGHISPNLQLRSTPPMEQDRPRQRKRKLVDRGPIVFSNDYMKEALNSSDHLLRKKVRLPNSFLGVWKLRQKLRKEQIFFEPSTIGLCADLSQINRDFICTKPNLVLSDEAFQGTMGTHPSDPINECRMPNEGSFNTRHPETSFDSDRRSLQKNDGQPGSSHQRDLAEYPGSLSEQNKQVECTRENKGDPSSSVQGPSSAFPEDDTQVECTRRSEGDTRNSTQGPSIAGGLASPPEIECRRDFQDDYGGNYVPDFVPSSFRRDGLVPVSVDTPISEPMAFGSGLLPTPDLGTSTGALRSDINARIPISREQLQYEVPNFSGIPDLGNSTGDEELNFLEGNDIDIGTPGTRDIDTLTVRTRAVAKYLKGNSPATPTSEGPLRDINLNNILEGKSRKICARMFFETLVLKSYGYVDTQQQEPYGDITLKLSSTLKSQF